MADQDEPVGQGAPSEAPANSTETPTTPISTSTPPVTDTPHPTKKNATDRHGMPKVNIKATPKKRKGPKEDTLTTTIKKRKQTGSLIAQQERDEAAEKAEKDEAIAKAQALVAPSAETRIPVPKQEAIAQSKRNPPHCYAMLPNEYYNKKGIVGGYLKFKDMQEFNDHLLPNDHTGKCPEFYRLFDQYTKVRKKSVVLISHPNRISQKLPLDTRVGQKLPLGTRVS